MKVIFSSRSIEESRVGYTIRHRPRSRQLEPLGEAILGTVEIYSGCARYIPVYVYISVKGSRVCKPCKVLAVRKYVRASMV